VKLSVSGLTTATEHRVRVARIDQDHSNIGSHCPVDVEWPDEALWAHLRQSDQLFEEELAGSPTSFEFALPMPGVVRVRLQDRGTNE
jgi:hypothetical protein